MLKEKSYLTRNIIHNPTNKKILVGINAARIGGKSITEVKGPKIAFNVWKLKPTKIPISAFDPIEEERNAPNAKGTAK